MNINDELMEKVASCAVIMDGGKQLIDKALLDVNAGKMSYCGFYAKVIAELEDDIQRLSKYVNEVKNPLMSVAPKVGASFPDMVCQIYDDEKELFLRKNRQYGQGDPLANFRAGAALQGLDGECLDDCFKTLLGYADKHIAFVHGERLDEAELNEKVAESLGDIANYCVIGLAMWKMKQGEE